MRRRIAIANAEVSAGEGSGGPPPTRGGPPELHVTVTLPWLSPRRHQLSLQRCNATTAKVGGMKTKLFAVTAVSVAAASLVAFGVTNAFGGSSESAEEA